MDERTSSPLPRTAACVPVRGTGASAARGAAGTAAAVAGVEFAAESAVVGSEVDVATGIAAAGVAPDDTVAFVPGPALASEITHATMTASALPPSNNSLVPSDMVRVSEISPVVSAK